MSIQRVKAALMQNIYHLKHSLEDFIETFFWPLIDIVLWGFITTYFSLFKPENTRFITFLLGALILWNIVYRAQQDMGFVLLRNVWSRNIINLFSSPLTPYEFMLST